MLAIIDYGAGNLRSVLHALRHLRAPNMQLVQAPRQLTGASKIILPGVGAFGASMAQLRAQGLVEPLQAAIAAGTPYLGICVGMQILYELGEEMGEHRGLGILGGRVQRFLPAPGLKVPHMGWNELQLQQETPLLAGLQPRQHVYFVHSYYCAPSDASTIRATVDYGIAFAAAVQHDALYGVQFHPEKSQAAGLQILSNFLKL